MSAVRLLFLFTLFGWNATSETQFSECLNCNLEEVNNFLEKTSRPYTSFSLTHVQNQNSKGKVLLIHGLTDSPYYLKDVAKSLYADGYDVYVPLLSGHGNDYKKLESINYETWLSEVELIINQLTADKSKLILGGFSNGGLISTVLLKNPEIQKKIKMQILIAPALEISISFASRLVLNILRGTRKWLSFEEKDFLKESFDKIRGLSLKKNWCPECSGNIKNKTLPLNGPLQVYNNLKDNLGANTRINIPTILIMSGDDKVIDTNKVADRFSKYFSSDLNHIFWLKSDKNKNLPTNIPPQKLTMIDSADFPVTHSGIGFESNDFGRSSDLNPKFNKLRDLIIMTMNSITQKLLCKSAYE